MNIIKFKDVILTPETAPLLTENQIEFFNDHLRGKYSYALNWKYAVPFEDATEAEFAQLSKELTLPAGVTVKFLDWDGTVLQDAIYNVGDMPTYEGETPSREDYYDPLTNIGIHYTFAGWDGDIIPVYGDPIYRAIYNEEIFHKYATCTFVDWNDEVLQESEVPFGEIPTYEGDTPVRDDEPTSNHSRWIHYTFSGWNKDLSPIYADTTYKAVYDSEEITKYATCRFINENEVIYETKVPLGEAPAYEGNEPIKPDDYNEEENKGIEYIFTGWDPEPEVVLEDKVYEYNAQYLSKPFHYDFYEGYKKVKNTEDIVEGENEKYIFVSAGNQTEETLQLYINGKFPGIHTSKPTGSGSKYNSFTTDISYIGVPADLDEFIIEPEAEAGMTTFLRFKKREDEYLNDSYFMLNQEQDEKDDNYGTYHVRASSTSTGNGMMLVDDSYIVSDSTYPGDLMYLSWSIVDQFVVNVGKDSKIRSYSGFGQYRSMTGYDTHLFHKTTLREKVYDELSGSFFRGFHSNIPHVISLTYVEAKQD